MSTNVRKVHYTALVLTIIGAINWGLVGLFQWDLVAAIFGGPAAPLARFVYIVVGLAGITVAFTAANRPRRGTTQQFRRAA